ncbi:NAD(P)H-quinone oxidoreductase [Ignatzschineria rhizosphaerae]|uniref:NAD(P)H-quinone oxidoreductase n=1 Tax=Ignatzschineria rhizosphaerae TaxID=2923279 RepID=A0ABY3X182_9GAMM|nr:NAD(P)H-quinone oxidoreductase [Ignatzschineria rhizosphaerae]UNM95222.1 NAD(P)H-quinone oxidoreductase [Ignatzschineria rhizosphaerae]
MKAVILTEFGEPSVLKLGEKERPTLNPHDILVKVKAAGVNRPDVIQRKGYYPAPQGEPQDILGLEVAGIVEEIGSDVTQWRVGDEVFSLIGGGGYAEYVRIDEFLALPKPKNLSFIEAASMPETLYTVWNNVFQRGQLKKGENFLVHGGSSGIGITAIQLAKIIGAKNIFTTVGNKEKQEAVKKLGATIAVNYKEEDFLDILKEHGVDVILDMIGGDYYEKNIDLLNPDGRLVYINSMGGAKVTANLMKIMQKRITLTGSTLRAREYEFKRALTEDIRKDVLPLLEEGHFKPVIYQVFPLAEADKAHELMESSEHIGKIVLEV